MLGVFGIAAPQAATQPPHGWLAWTLLIAGAMAGGLLATGVLAAFIPPEPPGDPRPPSWPVQVGRWLRQLLLPTAVLTLAIAVGIGAAVGIAAIRSALRGCTTPTEVPVVASPETLGTATALARAFELATARAGNGCPSASLSVYAADPTDVRQGLLNHWKVLANSGPDAVDYLHDLGPRPQVWMPDSTVDVDRMTVLIDRTGAVSPLGTPTIYSWSPLALAVGSNSAPVATPDTWLGLLQAYSGADFDVVIPDSNTSATGQLSLAASYPSDKSWGEDEFSVAQDIETVLASGREQAGYPLGDPAALLRRYQSTGCDPVAPIGLVLPEQFILRPDLAGRQVRADLGCPAEAPRLRAVGSPDAPVVNHVVVPLTWDTSAAGRAGVEFTRWLGSDAGHRASEAAGLHPGDRRSAEARSPDRVTRGLDPALVDLIDRAVNHRAEITRAVELLLAIDTSGSMANRFDLGTAVLGSTAERLNARDRLGLMTFGGGKDGVRFLVKPRSVGPVSSASGGQAEPGRTTRDAVRGALRRLRPAGGTPLLRALDLGLTTLLSRPTAEPEAIRALVMVTDGRDTVGGPNPGPATARARKAGVRVYVIATGSIDCTQPVLAAVTSDSGGRCMVAKDGPETTADALTAAIWGVTRG